MEYNGITYTQTASRSQKDGRIEVDAVFERSGIIEHTTFLFLDKDAITKEFEGRCKKKIDRLIIKRKRERTDEEIIQLIKDTKVAMNKETVLAWQAETVDVKGAI